MNFSLGLCLTILSCFLNPVFASPSGVAKSRDKRTICRSCQTLDLTSEPTNAINIIPIAGAAEVLRIELQTEISSALCEEGITYGAYGPTVWLTKGCIGSFKVCYQEGFITEITCQSTQFQAETCQTACEKIGSVAVKDQLSIFYACEKDLTYTVIDDNINVLFDCKADFYIGCQECRLNRDGRGVEGEYPELEVEGDTIDTM